MKFGKTLISMPSPLSGNTIKRVVIILTSVIVFGTKMTSQGVLGSSIAILGVLLYSLAKDYFK